MWDAGWFYRKAITIDYTQVDGDYANFAALIDTVDTDLASKAQSDGDDIAFTDAAGTKLSHEVESYDWVTGHLVAWVKVPLLSSSVDTVLYMYYGNGGAASQGDPEATWDSNYVMVQHLQETSGSHLDSTVTGNDGVAYGVIQDVVGKVDGADEFDGADDYVEVPHDSSLVGFSAFTAEAWVKMDDVSSRQGIFNKYSTASQRAWYLDYAGSRGLGLFVSDDGVAYSYAYGAFSPVAGEWYHVSVVWEAGQVPSFYVNGGLVSTTFSSGTVSGIYNGLTPLYVGRSWSATSRFFDGVIDEVRVSDVARSSGWIASQYRSMNGPATFFDIGVEETISITYIVTASAGVGGSIDPLGEVIVAEGADQTFTITPDIGYYVSDMLVDDVSVGLVSKYTFHEVEDDHTIEANFQYDPTIHVVSLDSSQIIGINLLSTGFQLDYPWEWREFRDRPEQQQLASDANIGFIRICDRHMGPLDYSQGVGPCEYWNEDTDTGVFDWTDVDSVVQAIFDVGAEPLIVISAWGARSERPTVPPGMTMNPDTRLPYPEHYGAFVAAWVQHFEEVGLPVKYYEIFNEIQTYIGWNWWERNEVRVEHFIDLYNAAYTEMHKVNPNVKVSFDASTLKFVFPRLLARGAGLDTINFHKYDDWKQPPNDFSDQKMFQRAEDVYLNVADADAYSTDYVRDQWLEERGEILPIIMSEGNFNAACNPTNERVQQMSGAVRTALVLRMSIIKGLTAHIYYTFTSDSYWEPRNWGSGKGYGMIDSDTRHSTSNSYDNPWYPYYVHKFIGSNIDIGDELIETSVESEDIRSLAWVNNQKINILIIHKNADIKTIKISGIDGDLNVFWIDNEISYENPSVQQSTISDGDIINLKGYTVMLIQSK